MLNIERNINPSQQHVSEYIEMPGGLIAHRYSICATSAIGYEVYERAASPSGSHSTFARTKEHGWLGDITTRRLPSKLDALPTWSDERSQAVKAWYRDLEQTADQCIRSAFPQDFADN